MGFTYRQKTPGIWHNGVQLDGYPIYSGHGFGLNNPDLEAIHNVGPIPAGTWRIVAWHDTWEDKGPVVAQLEPVGFDPHGRSGFLIHGDNAAANFTASDGCIIAPRAVREQMRATSDFQLIVIHDGQPAEELVA